MSATARVALTALAITLCGCATRPSPGAGSGRNRALLEAYVEAWNRHDAGAFDSLLATDAIHEDLAWGISGHGRQAIKEFMAAVITQEPDFTWQLTNVVSTGPWVAAEWTWTATYTGDSPNGRVVRQHITGRGACIVEVANDRIRRFTDYYDTASFFPRAKSDSLKP